MQAASLACSMVSDLVAASSSNATYKGTDTYYTDNDWQVGPLSASASASTIL